MTETTNFQLEHLEDSQDAKETSVNTTLERIDQRLAQTLTHNFTSDADYVLVTTTPDFEHLYYGYKFTDTSGFLTVARTVQFPANRGPFMFRNLTAVNLDVRVGGAGGSVTVGPNIAVQIYSDGTDMILTTGVDATGTSSAPYDMPLFIGGLPAGSSAIIAIRPFTRSVTFPAQPATVPYRGSSLVAATASTVMTLRKNGSSFGTVTFAAASSTATFTQGSDSNFIAGDVFTLTGPASADATLANVALTLATTRL